MNKNILISCWVLNSLNTPFWNREGKEKERYALLTTLARTPSFQKLAKTASYNATIYAYEWVYLKQRPSIYLLFPIWTFHEENQVCIVVKRLWSMNYRATRWEEKIGINELEIIIMNSPNFEIFLWKLWYVIEKERWCKYKISKIHVRNKYILLFLSPHIGLDLL